MIQEVAQWLMKIHLQCLSEVAQWVVMKWLREVPQFNVDEVLRYLNMNQWDLKVILCYSRRGQGSVAAHISRGKYW